MQAFVPKNRRPKFQLCLRIIDLNNVPLVTGTSYVKWDLPHSAAAEHRGRTAKCYIKDHRVLYEYEKTLSVRLTIDKENMLQETTIRFEIVQEYNRGERLELGNIKLNLAEYVEASEWGLPGEDEEEGVTRRYLMQQSKINSTLKVGIYMKHVEGDRNFIAPSLKTAPVFGGIAGIIAGEQGENSEDAGHVQALSSKSREAGEAQDIYRRNLAAFWTAQPGELRADDCIEDIFAGGDGWAKKASTPQKSPRKKIWSRDYDKDKPDWSSSSSATRKSSHHERHGSRESVQRNSSDSSPRFSELKFNKNEDTNPIPMGVGGRGSLEQHANEMKAQATSRPSADSYEVDEFDVRDDMRSWKLSEPVT